MGHFSHIGAYHRVWLLHLSVFQKRTSGAFPYSRWLASNVCVFKFVGTFFSSRFVPGGTNRQSDSNRAVRIGNAIRAGRFESAKRFEPGGPNRQSDSNRAPESKQRFALAARIATAIRTGRSESAPRFGPGGAMRIGRAIRTGRSELTKRFEPGGPNRHSDSCWRPESPQRFEAAGPNRQSDSARAVRIGKAIRGG